MYRSWTTNDASTSATIKTERVDQHTRFDEVVLVSDPLEDGSLDTETCSRLATCLGIQPIAPGAIITEQLADGSFRKKLSWRLLASDADKIRGL